MASQGTMNSTQQGQDDLVMGTTGYPDYKREAETFEKYLREHTVEGELAYAKILSSPDYFIVEVPLSQLASFDEDLAINVVNNTIRYHKLFCKVLDKILQYEEPTVLYRTYELRILPVGREGNFAPFDRISLDDLPPKALSLRNVKSNIVGKLTTVTGMVVKSSDVQPCVVVATYLCEECQTEAHQLIPEHQKEFMPVSMCGNCKGTVLPVSRGCKFSKYQTLKLQEVQDQVPMGQVPRSSIVWVKHELTRMVSPGAIITLDCIVVPQRVVAKKTRQAAGLLTTTILHAQNMIIHKAEVVKIPRDISNLVDEIAVSNDPISKLANSIAPEIYGHKDIKISLLLMLVGGVTRKLNDGMRIRGDINILLMGDPGVAKSQLLKFISKVAPRGIYTTGKGSSGVGLTAAITKDEDELSLEGGALVLSDRGICCIDEFDKMDERDRTALHEVMEQQTVSIAKAGIVATLNARTSVLAAANPIYGRYHRKKSLSENINLPNSLLSRFDLLFLILDTPDMEKDTALARHVTKVHQDEEMQVSEDAIPPEVLRAYISRAKSHEPVVPETVAPYIVEAYVDLRKQSKDDQTSLTARQLLSILRISQALARLRFADYVEFEDVDEAIRLTHSSKASLTDSQATKHSQDVLSKIFGILRDAGQSPLEMKLAEAMVVRKGFKSTDLTRCLDEYESLQVLQVNESKTQIYFLNGN